MQKYYAIDPDGRIDLERILEVRGTTTMAGEKAYWVREIGVNGLPVGKPERMFADDLVAKDA